MPRLCRVRFLDRLRRAGRGVKFVTLGPGPRGVPSQSSSLPFNGLLSPTSKYNRLILWGVPDVYEFPRAGQCGHFDHPNLADRGQELTPGFSRGFVARALLRA